MQVALLKPKAVEVFAQVAVSWHYHLGADI